MLNTDNSKKYKARGLVLAAFVYTSFCLQLAKADDIEIYTNVLDSGPSGDPVFTFVFDNSASMLLSTSEVDEQNQNAPHIFIERKFQTHNAFRDQLTSMKGTFKVGLVSYAVNETEGTVNEEANPLKLVKKSIVKIPVPGSYTQDITQDVAWVNGSAARDGESTLSFPYAYILNQSTSTDTTSIIGRWNSSAGRTSILANASYDYAGSVNGVNKAIKYYSRVAGLHSFRLNRGGNGKSPDPVLYLLDSNGTELAHNENYGFGTLNSGINFNLSANTEYILVAATANAGESGTFTLTNSNSTNGYFISISTELKAQNVALSFNEVTIPKGATISAATLTMQAQSGSAAQSLDVKVEQALAPDYLGGTTIDSSRAWFGQTIKSVPAAAAGGTVRIDVSALVKQKVAQNGWCVDRNLVFMIKATTPPSAPVPNPIVVHSAEGLVQPILSISWAAPTTTSTPACYSATHSQKTKASSEDVYQNADGSMHSVDELGIDNNTLETQVTQIAMGPGIKAGLRFAFINLPNANNSQGNPIGLVVDNASLQLTAANTNSAVSASSPLTISISAIEEGLVAPFTNDPGHLNERKLGTTLNFNLNSWVAGNQYTLPALQSLIQPLLAQQDWEYQGTMGFILSANKNASFYAYEDPNEEVVTNVKKRDKLGKRAPNLTISASSSAPFEKGNASRKLLWDKLQNSPLVHKTPLIVSYIEAANYMLGNGSYNSPLDNARQCASNTLVLLTDGADNQWTANTDENKAENIIKRESKLEECTGTWDCGNKVASALKKGLEWFDITTAPDTGIRSIKTYAIFFGPSTSQNDENLRTLVETNGGGKFYNAASASQLGKVFTEIIDIAETAGSSLSSAGISTSAFNRLSVLDEIYYSLFNPSTRRNWVGNTKRYSLNLSSNKILDVNGVDAIDDSGAFFKKTSHSWWSSAVDGSDAGMGGAAEHISPVNRKLYTYKGNNGFNLGNNLSMSTRGLDLTSSQGFNIMTNGSTLTNADVGLPASASTALKDQVIKWLQGGTAAAPRKAMGAALHASPVLVTYGKNTNGAAVNTLFVSNNEGYLHAINSGEPTSTSAATNKQNTGGKELFAFIPKETLKNAAILQENAVAPNKTPTYGLDASWTYWREDGGKDGTINGNDHVYLYGGMRRGGQMLYGLNVTDTTRPRLLFAIGYSDVENKATPVTGTPKGDITNFVNIGQTWSEPKLRAIKWGGQIRKVLFFGGGYDPRHDNPSHELLDDKGRQVYMVDATTGELLWGKGTKYSIAAGLRPFDRTDDGLIDGIYAVDLQGRVLRFDLNKAANDFVMYEIADLGGTGLNNRKFYAEPGISLLKNTKTGVNDFMIAVSSGYREKPFDQTVQEQFFMIFDRNAYAINPTTGMPSAPSGKITIGDLNKVSILSGAGVVSTASGLSRDPNDVNGIYQIQGWTYAFEKAVGEKGTGSPLIFNGIVYFTTYTNNQSSSVCSPVVGNTRVYILDIAGKASTYLFGGTGPFLNDVVSGMASGVQIIDGSLLVDKNIIPICGDGTCNGDGAKYETIRCEIVGCQGRDLDRATWTTKSMGAKEGRLP